MFTVKEYRRFPLDDLTRFPGNPKHGDIETIMESLATLGQYRSIVVNEEPDQLVVLAGNHTFDAARLLGWTHIDGGLVEVDQETALRINLVDNRTSDLGRYDDRQLLAQLESLQVTDLGLTATGFNDNTMQDILKRIQPLDLDDLRRKYEEDNYDPTKDIWPEWRIKLPPDQYRAWVTLLTSVEGEDDYHRLQAVMDLAAR